MTVAKLTPEQAEQLKGTEFAPDSYFNPIVDKHGNYIISLEEVEQCDIEWVKDLEMIIFVPKEYNLPI
jgi:hypothetical protein